jgi:chromosome segregation ATPase
MHLSSITIKGFKSFPERTRLVFSPGVSVIVGPNGCGKSNITDAVLWALGEQSPLAVRGQSMQDMVFAGGDGRGPSRAAEVEVVLDNGDGTAGEFAEISVRRRHDRSGEGEYRLNGARCRLVDVIEALSDANLGREMHSVISQGRVEEIVHSKPRDRRLLVEEAAGLGKHRKRRRRAQLKLERTQENLDRALDVEREARSRLRPLKRQAQAADIHARLEREADELRGHLLGSELANGGGQLAAAEREVASARRGRDEVETELGAVNERRTEIEERMAERDRERTEAWGRLTALRAAHERITVRAEALAARRAELAQAIESRRAALGALAEEAGARAGSPDGDPVDGALERIGEALGEAGLALGRARTATGLDRRAAEVSAVRDAAERAVQSARRVEGLLGRGRQDSLGRRIESEGSILRALERLCEGAADARDAAGERAAALERTMLGEREGDDVTAELRSCSRREAELQARLRTMAEAVTQAEVAAAQLRDRRDETAAELQRIAARLGRELGPAEAPLPDEEREQIEAKLERLARRREQLGPVNPLAESEYQEALAHVNELEEQRTDLENALGELGSLIRETDRKIHDAFEQTLDATQRNFEELVEHLFPGGRGRLRLVGERSPRLVLGGEDLDAGGEDAEQGVEHPAGAEAGADEASPSRGRGQGVRAGAEQPAGSDFGVEIEVTPAGKATRRLSLLSGGEKSLVALAFVFAVFLARPSPFYILDEVEAALDDSNIDRFLQLVRRFSDRAQFIIVTHQKRTMDAADVLYGVSMGSGGVTKVISRRMAREEQAELAESEAA